MDPECNSFWGLFRLGEVLPGKARSFDKTSVLLWEDVKFSKEKVILNLRQPKTRSQQSKTVVLYKLSAEHFCPVRQLRQLKKLQKKMGIWKKDLPIFLWASGGSLTKSTCLKKTNAALKKIEPAAEKFQGKSFRSGIPPPVEKIRIGRFGKEFENFGSMEKLRLPLLYSKFGPRRPDCLLTNSRSFTKKFFVQEKKPENRSA